MTTTLDVLLADPSPEARAIAADWLEERGEPLPLPLVVVRLRSLGQEDGYQQLRGYMGESMLTVMLDPLHGLCCWRPVDLLIWIWRDGRGWSRYGDDEARPQTPPPVLEAAVLAVLRRRLEEAQRA